MALKRDKDVIDFQGDDEIKRNRLFFDFMLRMFDHLNQLYEKEKKSSYRYNVKISFKEREC